MVNVGHKAISPMAIPSVHLPLLCLEIAADQPVQSDATTTSLDPAFISIVPSKVSQKFSLSVSQ